MQSLTQALESPEFYVQLALIGALFGAAWFLSLLTRRFLDRHITGAEIVMRRPLPHWLPPEALTQPAKALLTPLFLILALSVAQPTLEKSADTGLLEGALAVSTSWLLMRLVLLLVNTRPVAWFIVVVIFIYTLLSVTGLMQPASEYMSAFAVGVGKYRFSMLNLINGVIMLVVVFWLAATLSRMLEATLRRSTSLSYNARELLGKLASIVFYFTAFLVTLNAIGVDLTAFAVLGGALGVGIGLGLQKITANFISGVTILMEKSIKIGDLVEIGGVTGWVRQLHMRYALLETFDGRELIVPNEELLTSRVTNWTFSSERARIDISITVTYESDPEITQREMLAAAKAHPLCMDDPEPGCWLREFGDNGLVFLMTFWIANVKDGRFTPQSEVMFDILKRFKKEGISMAFPTRELRTFGSGFTVD